MEPTFKLITAKEGNISEYYNQEFLKEPRVDIYGFISVGDVMINNGINIIKSCFIKNMNMIGVVYSDKLLRKNNLLIPQIYPTFDSASSTIYNPTIFVNGHIKATIFNNELEHLRSFDVIQKLSQVSQIIHIPEFLISSEFCMVDIRDELEKYVRQSN
jgi:hypothetical protein